MFIKAVDVEVGMDIAGVGVVVEVVEVSSVDVAVNIAATPNDGYSLDDYDSIDQFLFEVDEELEVINQ